MGATTFFTTAHGKTAEKAFDEAVQEAKYWHGNSGYTGTIAEKDGFKKVPVPDGVNPYDHAMKLILEDENTKFDKWGPAGCIELSEETFLFFGWSPE